MTDTDRQDSLRLLRAVPSLRRLDDRDLERIGARVELRAVGAGDVLIEEGTTGQDSFLVVEGEASVLVDGAPIATVGAGEFVGELALLTDAPRCATVRADSPMQLLVFDRDALVSLLDPITEALLGTLARRLQRDHGATTAPADATAPWAVGATVAVRSRYEGAWVDGFEIADIDLASDPLRLQLRRRSDEAVLPVWFSPDDVRPS